MKYLGSHARAVATYRWYRSLDVGQRADDGARTPEDLSSGEVAAAKMAHPEWTTKSATVLRCLAFLDTFSGAAPGRSAGPTATGANAQ